MTTKQDRLKQYKHGRKATKGLAPIATMESGTHSFFGDREDELYFTGGEFILHFWHHVPDATPGSITIDDTYVILSESSADRFRAECIARKECDYDSIAYYGDLEELPEIADILGYGGIS